MKDNNKSDRFAEMAKRQVEEHGEKVFDEFDLTRGTAVSCLHVGGRGDEEDRYLIFLYGKLIGASPSWSGATILASALAKITIELYGEEDFGEKDFGKTEKGEW